MKTFRLFVATVLLLSFSCSLQKEERIPKRGHEYNDSYTGEYLNRIAFPIGGLGAGMFCLEGTGSISHMSIRNRPEVFNEPCMFAAISVKGFENGSKIIEGPVPGWKRFGEPGSGNGSGGTTYGFPRFAEAEFSARFPFATIKLSDEDIPVSVEVTGWSPFIPTDADNSGLPAGAVEYLFKNSGTSEIEAVFSYNSRNFMSVNNGKNRIRTIQGGFILTEEGSKERPETKGDFAIFSNEASVSVDHCWFRGGWFDPLTITWEAVMNGEIRATDPAEQNAPGASFYIPFILKPGESRTVRVMMAWYVPDSNLKLGKDSGQPWEAEKDPECSCNDPWYRPWYSGKFRNVEEVAGYWETNYNDLRSKSALFRDTFYNSTLSPEVIEAIGANLTILKSPTVLRQRDGRLWSWEGCSDNSGCCAGSCTHVWNYAQAIPHLFPALERTLRETEFFPSQSTEGHQTFRAALPIRPVAATFYAASDGQLGGIMKMHRDWRISGNNEWLRKMYPKVVESMEYCIRTWDPKSNGTLEEPHHNTYDIEF